MLRKAMLGVALQGVLTSLGDLLNKDLADKLLDVIEDHVANTPAQWDDLLIGKACEYARIVANIPDNDDGPPIHPH